MIDLAPNHIPSLKPRVAQLLYSGLGGHGGVVFAMIDADAQRRWEHRLGFLGIEPLLPAYAERCLTVGLPHQYIPAIAGRPWRSYRSIYKWLTRAQPNVVLLHSLPALLPIWLYGRLHKVPIVVIEHQHNKQKSRQDWFFSRVAMVLADAVVVLTPFYRAELAASLGRSFRSDKVHLIPNGIDAEAFKEARPFTRSTTNVVRIGMAARFTHGKRFDLVLDMLRVLRSQHPETAWQLSLAGDGEHLDELRRSADGDQFGKSLVFEGMLTGTALIEWFRGLDIYCHASDGETLSISVLQAMAAGLPVVASDVEGINDLLSGERPLGVLVSSPSGAAFAGAIQSVFRSRKESHALGQRASYHVTKKYSNAVMRSAYDDLVASLIANKRGRTEQ